MELSGVNVRSSFIYFQMDGRPFRVRVFEIGDKSRETLVFMHGYLQSSLNFAIPALFKPLADKYRVVFFDHGSTGLNTRYKK